MYDFSKILAETVEHKRGPLVEAKKPAEPAAKSLGEMVKMLKGLAKTVDQQVKLMDGEMQQLLDAVRHNLGSVKTQFKGLRHLSSEQQAHIEQITTEANDRLKDLKRMLKPLKDMKGGGSVQDLINRVKSLESELAEKSAEMDAQKMDYEEVLDYYESIMVDMKKAEMEAKRELQNAKFDMASAFDHTALLGNVIAEATTAKPEKKEKKKKVKADVSNYGTFDLNEYLARAREENPKSRHDW